MENLRESEVLIQCPYNASHHIRHSRMEVHLTKCRRSYVKESADMSICDFNASHRIHKLELQYHHERCPSRKAVELQIFAEDKLPPIKVPTPLVPVPIDDSWDNVAVESYNPEEHCADREILRRIDTQSAAVRRAFRQSERERFNNLPQQQEEEKKPKKKTPGNRVQDLPPVPKYAPRQERAPAEITAMMASLELKPTAVIPKRK